MSNLLERTLDFRGLTPGRRIVATRQTRELVKMLPDEKVDQDLIDAIDVSLETNEEAREKHNWWRRDRQVDEQARERANELDVEIDRTVGALHDTLKAKRKAFRGMDSGEAAAEILEKLFPDGAAGITTLPFEDELSAVRFVVEQLGDNWSDAVDELGVRSEVDRLSSLADQFADALTESAERNTTWDEVRAADQEGQKAMLRVVVEILGRFNRPDEIETARELLAPILEQDERVGDLHRRNRRISDIDPESGEEETPDGSGETPGETDSGNGESDGTNSGDSESDDAPSDG
jgi:hypothetical protein